MISIVIPTVPGREECYQKAVEAYHKNTVYDFEIITVFDKPNVGTAWNEGSETATGKFIHLSNDDIEPRVGWDIAAVDAARKGLLVHPAVHYPLEGRTDLRYPNVQDWDIVQMSTIPFLPMEAWKKIGKTIPTHYYSDDWIALVGRKHGYETVFRSGYAFDHYPSPVRRGASHGDEHVGIQIDGQYFNEAVRTESWK